MMCRVVITITLSAILASMFGCGSSHEPATSSGGASGPCAVEPDVGCISNIHACEGPGSAQPGEDCSGSACVAGSICQIIGGSPGLSIKVCAALCVQDSDCVGGATCAPLQCAAVSVCSTPCDLSTNHGCAAGLRCTVTQDSTACALPDASQINSEGATCGFGEESGPPCGPGLSCDTAEANSNLGTCHKECSVEDAAACPGTATCVAFVEGGQYGDCQCDSLGKCKNLCESASSCAIPAAECTADVKCGENGKCKTTPAPLGTPCDHDGSVCSSNAYCVPCNESADCPPSPTVCQLPNCFYTDGRFDNAPDGTPCNEDGGTVCERGRCTLAGCLNHIKDNDETDTDCGGSCALCTVGLMCNTSADCTGGACGMGVCQPPSCNDGVQDADETDVDCGSFECGGCSSGAPCIVGYNCAQTALNDGHFCYYQNGSGRCASCVDGTKNGNETGVDCGGPQCDAVDKTCGLSVGCSRNADCQSDNCQGQACAP